MWYFAWILGTLLACAFGIITALALALIFAGCIFWQPTRFAAKTSSLEIWQGLLLIWAVCAGVIHGFGFRPQRNFWRALFTPLPAICGFGCRITLRFFSL
ncbi:cytochrome bd-I oxidase subunit CydX [Serratia symbiotica]|nr:cytochrome bd-I oxidase subunit CydX [Serratia symbiotica]NIG87655.1 cytochrome bd-I oxidase subunit CydX [Serratia symbiotica]USS96705.1 cytochrome bd-I oxidase subunit CydX [Serratia symbiotica]